MTKSKTQKHIPAKYVLYGTGIIIFIALIVSLTSGSVYTQTIVAKCSASGEGCPQGAQCVVDNNNPANNYCKGGILPCGAEPGSCVDRCTNQPIPNCDPSAVYNSFINENKLIYMFGSLVAVLFLVIIILIVLLKQKKTIKKK